MPYIDTRPPLLRLPVEVRLQIYGYLIQSPLTDFTTRSQNYHEYEKTLTKKPKSEQLKTPVLELRNLDPLIQQPRRRGQPYYAIRTGRFRAQTVLTTFHIPRLPTHPIDRNDYHTSILAVNKQIHNEAADVLYGGHIFSFDVEVEAIIPFLANLRPETRLRIKRLAFVRRALPYLRSYDHDDWTEMCEYLSKSMNLSHLYLGVVAGKPGPQGWNNVVGLPTEFFIWLEQRWKMAEMMRESNISPADGVMRVLQFGPDQTALLGWVRQLMTIKGLRDVHVRAIIEHCPPPSSEMMAFWVEYSKSIDGPFGEWIRRVMVGSEGRELLMPSQLR